MTLIKICGIKTADEAMATCGLCPDFIGLIFVPGTKRNIEVTYAASLVASIRETFDRPPKIVGVFADQAISVVENIISQCNLDLVQLSGNEPTQFLDQLSVPAIKVIHVGKDIAVHGSVSMLRQRIEDYRDNGHTVILDSKSETAPGGTGTVFDWDIAKSLGLLGIKFFLAGGLGPNNICDALSIVDPYGVDVSTGVETDGQKDTIKVQKFIQYIRSHDSRQDLSYSDKIT